MNMKQLNYCLALVCLTLAACKGDNATQPGESSSVTYRVSSYDSTGALIRDSVGQISIIARERMIEGRSALVMEWVTDTLNIQARGDSSFSVYRRPQAMGIGIILEPRWIDYDLQNFTQGIAMKLFAIDTFIAEGETRISVRDTVTYFGMETIKNYPSHRFTETTVDSTIIGDINNGVPLGMHSRFEQRFWYSPSLRYFTRYEMIFPGGKTVIEIE